MSVIFCNCKHSVYLRLFGNLSNKISPMIAEYGQDGIVSKCCDVYSFGIMMMETFTGMRPSDEMFTGDLSLRYWINDSFPSGVVYANLLKARGRTY